MEEGLGLAGVVDRLEEDALAEEAVVVVVVVVVAEVRPRNGLNMGAP